MHLRVVVANIFAHIKDWPPKKGTTVKDSTNSTCFIRQPLDQTTTSGCCVHAYYHHTLSLHRKIPNNSPDQTHQESNQHVVTAGLSAHSGADTPDVRQCFHAGNMLNMSQEPLLIPSFYMFYKS